MKFAKIEFESREVCAQAYHGLIQRGRVIALQEGVFIVPAAAVDWLSSQRLAHRVVEWLNQDDVIQTLRNTLAHPV
ncbi:MAG: hypothetical protein HY360_11170 [Verrucomicrobia bacterium]|nr:hypothetical protein [Verrucomicrobiota bacterium]